MKNKNWSLLFLIAIITVMISCKKEKEIISETSSLTIVNCLSDATFIFPQLYNSSNIDFSKEVNGMPPALLSDVEMMRGYGLKSGIVPLKVLGYPDKEKPLSNNLLNLEAGGIYSFFLSGTKLDPDTLFVKDELPVTDPSDSLIVIRFINTLKNFNAIRVKAVGGQATTKMEHLAYNQISPYQVLSVSKLKHKDDEHFNFEIYDAVTGDLLSIYDYIWSTTTQSGNSNYLSKAVTIIMTGSPTSLKFVAITPNLYH